MSTFNISKFQKAYEKAGKKVLVSNFEVKATFGTIATTDPAFGGRRTGEFGEYLQLKNADNGLMFVSIAKGSPKGANLYEIKQLVVTEDFEIDGKKIEAGTETFKAYVVAEVEE